MIRTSVSIAPGRPSNQDRAAVFGDRDHAVLVLADGAGGIAGGGLAAEFVVEFVRERADRIAVPLDVAMLESVLRAADLAMSRSSRYGEATGVVAVVHDGVVAGVSVGDSGAWLVAKDRVVDLTAGQH